MTLTLVVLAAGMGSRYGGIKQMEPVGPGGEFILDYSVHDAVRAGFANIVFVIRRDLDAPFRSTVLRRMPPGAAVRLVHQESDTETPPGFLPPVRRVKPWGTGHAVLAAAGAVDEPFAVINADDFYGRESFEKVAAFLRDTASDPSAHAMVAFVLRNTLSEHGAVSRGVCTVGPDGLLSAIRETAGIRREARAILSDAGPLTGDEPVSMNMWAFKPSFFARLRSSFAAFLERSAADPKAEFYLPSAVGAMLEARQGTVAVLATDEKWFGMTNPSDRPAVERELRARVAAGIYPPSLPAASLVDRQQRLG